MITKRQIGTIFRRLGKKHGFDYYAGFECCNSCFVANLPDGHQYVYIKHGLKGMNYETSNGFNARIKWYFAYELSNWKEVFTEFKKEAEKIKPTQVIIPESTDECLVIIRSKEKKNAKV